MPGNDAGVGAPRAEAAAMATASSPDLTVVCSCPDSSAEHPLAARAGTHPAGHSVTGTSAAPGPSNGTPKRRPYRSGCRPSTPWRTHKHGRCPRYRHPPALPRSLRRLRDRLADRTRSHRRPATRACHRATAHALRPRRGRPLRPRQPGHSPRPPPAPTRNIRAVNHAHPWSASNVRTEPTLVTVPVCRRTLRFTHRPGSSGRLERGM
jgi:hypothetical protein